MMPLPLFITENNRFFKEQLHENVQLLFLFFTWVNAPKKVR